eukprot:COSAG02_NODE_273_length_26316_cov_13.661060_5_plen_857_part_00
MGMADRLMFSTVRHEDGGATEQHSSSGTGSLRVEDRLHSTIAVLHSVPLFRPLSNVQMQKLADALVRSEIAAGDVVIREGDAGDLMFIVEEGYLLASTRQHGMVKEYAAGSFFGELALVTDEPRKATITAAQDSVLLGLGRAAVRSLLRGDLVSVMATTQDDYRLAESVASTGSLSFPPGAGINERKGAVRAHLDSVRRAAAGLERVGRAADASKLRADVDTLQQQLTALRLEGGIWNVGIRAAQSDGPIGGRVRPSVLELDKYGRLAAWALTDSGCADHSNPLAFCFIDQVLSVEAESELGLPPSSVAAMPTGAQGMDHGTELHKTDSLEFSTAVEGPTTRKVPQGGAAARKREGSGGSASGQEMRHTLAGGASNPRALDASAASWQFDFGDISSQRGWIYKEEEQSKRSGPSLRRKGELALSTAKGSRSGSNFHRLWCEIHDGRVSWWKHDPRDHEVGVLNEQIASGWLLGCTLSPPKTRRKGFPFCFRVELAQPDDSGQQKYILGTDSQEEFDLWRASFASSDMSRSLDYRTLNSRVRGTIREGKEQITQAPQSIRDSLRQSGHGGNTGTGVTLRMHKHLAGAQALDIRFDDSEEAKELARCMRGALHRHSTCRRGCVRQVQRVQQRLLKRFDGESEWDLAQLRQLWAGVYGEKPYVQGTSEFETKKAWISDGWVAMGFQNADPSTDLRGMNMLAIHCLLRLTEIHPALVSSIFSVTQERQGSYPFALAGINLCQMMIGLLHLAEVDTADLGDPDEPGITALPCLRSPLFALFCSLPEGVDVFEAVFAALFELLERTWVQSGATFMEFNFVLEKIQLAMKGHLDRRGTLDEMDTLTVDCSNMREEMAAAAGGV